MLTLLRRERIKAPSPSVIRVTASILQRRQTSISPPMFHRRPDNGFINLAATQESPSENLKPHLRISDNLWDCRRTGNPRKPLRTGLTLRESSIVQTTRLTCCHSPRSEVAGLCVAAAMAQENGEDPTPGNPRRTPALEPLIPAGRFQPDPGAEDPPIYW